MKNSIAAFLLRALGGLLLRTLSYSVRNDAAVRARIKSGNPFVLTFWHGSMFYAWWRMRNTNASALISRSSDGQILAGVLEKWKYMVIRGSSSRGSKEAMELMRDAVRQGHILCVTPDGPRGPLHEMKMGAVRVAQTMQVPLIIVSVGYKRSRKLRSWDRFEVPAPFTKAVVEFSDPIFVDAAFSGEALDEYRAQLEKRMQQQHGSVQAEARAGSRHA
jgi:Kdo2-lipid IVA 3' secondary acyltransferase